MTPLQFEEDGPPRRRVAPFRYPPRARDPRERAPRPPLPPREKRRYARRDRGFVSTTCPGTNLSMSWPAGTPVGVAYAWGRAHCKRGTPVDLFSGGPAGGSLMEARRLPGLFSPDAVRGAYEPTPRAPRRLSIAVPDPVGPLSWLGALLDKIPRAPFCAVTPCAGASGRRVICGRLYCITSGHGHLDALTGAPFPGNPFDPSHTCQGKHGTIGTREPANFARKPPAPIPGAPVRRRLAPGQAIPSRGVYESTGAVPAGACAGALGSRVINGRLFCLSQSGTWTPAS